MQSNHEQVVLVNERDEVVGIAEKIQAHKLGLLHRAFSVFVYRKTNEGLEFLLQQRHQDKYHCSTLWSNTCCSHPQAGEDIVMAGQRRLQAEMGLSLALTHIGSFQYKAEFANGLTEHELDHVLLGEYDGLQPIILHPQEAQDFCWIDQEKLMAELSLNPDAYTPWLKPALGLVMEKRLVV